MDEVNASDRDLIKGLSQGEIVTIQSGPFAGHEAIFDACLSGNERVRVLLKLINKQQLPLDIPSGVALGATSCWISVIGNHSAPRELHRLTNA